MRSDPGAREPSDVSALLADVKPTALRICSRYRIPPQDAEDMLQQTTLAMLDSRRPIHNPRAWFAGTLRNQCLMYWRRRRRRLYQAVDSAVLEALADPTEPEQRRVEFSRDLSRTMRSLPDRCRNVLKLRYGLGCRPKEAAERLGYRTSSIYKILERCLAALSKNLLARDPNAEAACSPRSEPI